MQTEEPFYNQAFFNQTTLHPLGMAVVLVMGVLTLTLPRRYATFPILVVVCFIPTTQRWVLLGLDFTLLRTMVMFGWLRLMMRGEFKGARMHRIDYAVILFAVVGSAAYTLLRGDFSALVYRAGTSFDALGMYFLFRYLVRTWTDLDRFVSCTILISIPVAVCFLIEKNTGRNPFSIFGGVSEFTHIRDGRLRCRGAYSHPIHAGCFWAALVPLIAYKWHCGRKGRRDAVIGLVCAASIIISCASSTPVVGLAAAAGGMLLFRFRYFMHTIRWGVICMLVLLHLVMEQPVWHLLSRIDIAGGSTGWHRFYLVDQAIKRFGEWCLLGVESTAHWGHGLYDVTNQYIVEGTRGGFLTLVFFCLIIGFAFAGVGRQVRINRSSKRVQYLAWALGVSLFVHAVNMVATSYFGGIMLGLYGTFGMVGALCLKKSAAAGSRSRQHPPSEGYSESADGMRPPLSALPSGS
jgi:hypothetical protein